MINRHSLISQHLKAGLLILVALAIGLILQLSAVAPMVLFDYPARVLPVVIIGYFISVFWRATPWRQTLLGVGLGFFVSSLTSDNFALWAAGFGLGFLLITILRIQFFRRLNGPVMVLLFLVFILAIQLGNSFVLAVPDLIKLRRPAWSWPPLLGNVLLNTSLMLLLVPLFIRLKTRRL